MDLALAQQVRARAAEACEYCRLPQSSSPTLTFPIDHIIAQQHRGPTILGNLALSCLNCNSHKGPNLTGIDPKTKKLTRLFHPRRHRWGYHFRYDGAILVGRTAIGRTTIAVLNMNNPEVVKGREELIAEGLFSLSDE